MKFDVECFVSALSYIKIIEVWNLYYMDSHVDDLLYSLKSSFDKILFVPVGGSVCCITV